MKEIFISYSSADIEQATTVRTVLEKNNLSCWMAPRDIPGGSNYTKEIPIAIRNCTVFLLILSGNAQNSHWVLKELDSAVNCGKVILPFMVEDCNLNDEFNFLLTGAQRYSAYQRKAEAMETLIGRIRGILGTPASGSEPANEAVSKPAEHPIPEVKKTPPTPASGTPKCPACGSTDLTPKKNKLICENGKERVTKICWTSIPGILFFLVAIFVISPIVILIFELYFLTFFEAFFLYFLLPVAGLVLGCLWGNRIARNKINRNRIRSGFSSTCYCCNRCEKVFDHKDPLNN